MLAESQVCPLPCVYGVEKAYNTYGYSRYETIGAVSNSVFLIAVCFNLFVESITKYV